MDNDDNDYQGQGLHLVGEESSKISPVLRPYALPKFDFDEGHLRFDSLVENEVFLGIPSQEDNQWIEDFPRGNSGIEFSSSAAESCSIPRHNNVWSEATSSESVEMLLKSVGQEDIVAGESIIEESDAGNVLPSLTEPMEHNLRQNDKADEIKEQNSELPTTEFLGSFTSLDQNPEGGCVQSNYVSQPEEVDLSAYGYSSSIGEKTSITNEDNLNVDLKCNEDNVKESHTSMVGSLDNEMHDPSASVVETGSTEHSPPNTVMSSGQLNVEDKISNISNESVGGIQEEICKLEDQNVHEKDFAQGDEKLSKSSVEASVTNLHSGVHVAPELDIIAKSALEKSSTGLPESSDVQMEGNFNLPAEKEYTVEEQSLEPAPDSRSALVPAGTESTLQSGSENLLPGNSSITPQEAGDGSGRGQTMEVRDNNAHTFCSALNKESHEGSSIDKKDDYLESSGKGCENDSVILTDVSSGMYIETKKQDEHGNDDGDIDVLIPQKSISVGSAEAEVVTESSTFVDTAEICDDNPKVVDHISPPEPTVSSDKCGEVSTELPLHDHNQDTAIQERDGGGSASDPNTMHNETAGPHDDGRKVGLSSLDKVPEEIVEETNSPELDASLAKEPASDAKTEDINTGPHETVHDDPSFPVSGTTSDVVSNPDEDGKFKPSGVESLHSDKDTTEAPRDASMPLLESGDVVSEQFSDSVATKGALANSAAAVVSEDIGQSLVESSGKGNHVDQAVADVHQEFSEKTETPSIRIDLEKSDAAEEAGLLKHKESTAAKDLQTSLGGGGNSSEVGNPDTGFASIVAASELPQCTKEQQAGTVEGVVANVSHSDGAEGIGDASLTPMPPGVKDVAEGDRSFTFDVSPLAGLPEGETAKGWQSFSSTEASKTSTLVESSPSTSGRGQIDPLVQEVSHGSSQKPDKRVATGGSRGVSERKTRRGSAKSIKENARRGNQVKETVPMRQTENADASSAFFSPSGTGKLMPVELGNVERSGAKPSGVVSVSGSSLPDLNTSSPSSVLFHQPFTDMQQVQLRAQIFVYGSLIQGVAPDEACMVSAFGISDAGRAIWEPAWRACIERLHGQKPHASNMETPVQSRSGAKASDQANKQGLSQSKVRASSKSTPPPVVNPMIPLSSPLWNVPTPSCETLPTNNLARGAVLDYQTLSPVHAFQTPALRNFAGHTTSWVSQAPFPVPWVASPQSSPFDVSAHFPALPATETVKVTAVKESSALSSSIAKHTSPLPAGVSSSVPPGASLVQETRKATVAHTHTVDVKSRKRKKTSGSEDVSQAALPVSQTISASTPVRNTSFASKGPAPEGLGPAPLLPPSQAELMSASAANGQFSTSVAIASPPSSAFRSNLDMSVRSVSPISSHNHLKIVDQAVEKRALQPEDIAKIKEAKLQAEEAAAHAAVAVSHCQNVWSELDRQKNSGLMPDVEVKLASAAAAIAAATSVAKAAAAAAKIASNAATQAKQMADEALISSGTLNPVQNDPISLPGFVNSIGNATPASILKVGDGNNGSSSIIMAAREASRRRMEAASAASRHAENLDAVVKAAELAAEAVSQAGKIVALGEPLPLSKLAEAGPEGYWKSTETPSGQDVRSNNLTGNTSNVNSVEEVPAAIEHQSRPSDKEVHTTDHVTSPHPRETYKNLTEDHVTVEELCPASVSRVEKDLRGAKSRRTCDSSKTISVVPESEIGLRSNEHESMADALNDNNNIRENSLVEVFKDNGEFGAWFSANVLNLKDGKAFVCYTELESDEGKLREWVPLDAHANKPPIIRLANPITSVMFEGTRKRRRAAVRDHFWSLGDRVDAWMENCWREGVIVEKNKKDESTLSVHFPVQGKISVVKVWHLRPTRMWKDGEWIELPITGQDFQGDTPQEKRLKQGNPAIEGKGKGKVPNNTHVSEPRKSEESSLLRLSAADKVFNIGSTKNDNKPETLRTMRSGLQKEGSKVIFGVPKPGKKRKFMEVSKHYTSDQNIKTNASTDSDKFAKYVMPQGPGSRVWRNNSKIDAKEKQAAESKSKGFKSGKPPSVSTRTLPRKESPLVSSVAAPRDAALTDNVARNSTSNDKEDSSDQNLNEFVSSSNVKEGAESMSLSSQAPTSNFPKKMAATSVKSERLKKGKLAPAGGKSSKVEEKEKSVPEVVEPRRSNRRIQPTSRLLEGLQSSLIISKIPSVSHDKSHRGQNKGVSKGNN